LLAACTSGDSPLYNRSLPRLFRCVGAPLHIEARLNSFRELWAWRSGVLRLGNHKWGVDGTVYNLPIELLRRFRGSLGKFDHDSSLLKLLLISRVQCDIGWDFLPQSQILRGRDIETLPPGLPSVSAAPWETHYAHRSLDRSESPEAESDSNPFRPTLCLWLGRSPGLASLRTCCQITPADRYRICRGRSR
jgi:hypothetical protein